MKEFATWALDTAVARGATYAEVRVLDTRQRYISTKNGQTFPGQGYLNPWAWAFV